MTTIHMRARRAILALVAGCVGLSGPLAASPQTPTVQITGGAVAGMAGDGVEAFLGIPYAAPPVGKNRWRAPQPVSSWAGVRAADRYASDCAQNLFPGDAAPLGTEPAEDCLYLNVWRPAGAGTGTGTGKKLPVMVWLHGGGFVNGGSSAPVYSGAPFARDGVIMVSLNYRLGRFGFFAHPALRADGGGGNFGFMDQIAALKWVKQNIAAFGGDPSNVTIFGESAGGISVHVLMTSPMARGLFAKAIVQSGGGRGLTSPLGIPTFAEARAAGKRFSGKRTSAAALRRLTTDQVIRGLDMTGMDVPDYSGPMIDGRTVVKEPLAAYRAGEGAAVPIILGTNSMDGLPFGNDKDALFGAFGKDAEQARRMYDPDGDTPVFMVATYLFADRYMLEPTRAVARTLASRQPVWLYRFGYVADSMRQEWPGAPHASEIPYVMGTMRTRYGTDTTIGDERMSAAMHRYWVAFAKTGRPAGAHLPDWPTFAAGSGLLQYFAADRIDQRPDPRAAQLDFMSTQY